MLYVSCLMASTTITGTYSIVGGPISNTSNIKVIANILGSQYNSSSINVTNNTFTAVFNNLPANSTITGVKVYSSPTAITYDGKDFIYPEIISLNASTNLTSINVGSLSLSIINRQNIKVTQNVNTDAFRNIDDALLFAYVHREYFWEEIGATPPVIREYRIILDRGRYAPFTMNSMSLSGTTFKDMKITLQGIKGYDPYNETQSTVFKYPATGANSNFISDISYSGNNPQQTSIVKALFTIDHFEGAIMEFKNITFTEFYSGINFTIQKERPSYPTYNNSGMNKLMVNNCTFSKLANKRDTYHLVPGTNNDVNYLKNNGCAVISEFPVEVNNSLFFKNSIYHLSCTSSEMNDHNTCLGTAIFVKTNSNNAQSKITNCTFDQNQGRGGIVFVESASNNTNTSLLLENNSFINNYIRNCINLTDPTTGFNSPLVHRVAAAGLDFINFGTGNLTAKFNKFYTTQYSDYNLSVNDPYIFTPNNPTGSWSVTAPQDVLESVMNKALVILGATNNYLQNNTFSGYKQLCLLQIGEASNTSINAVNNLFNPNYNPTSATRPFPYRGAHSVIGSYNFYNAAQSSSNPALQTIMPATQGNLYKLNNEPIDLTTLAPIWSSTQKSYAIDNGSSDLNNNGTLWYDDTADQDIDGSRMDIGAVVSSSHSDFKHSLVRATNNTVNWICFPYLDALYNNGNNNTIDNMFNNYNGNMLFQLQPRIITHVHWDYNTESGTAYYYSGSLLHTDFVLKSQYGLKVALDATQLNLPAKTLVSTGFLCGTEGNSNNTIHIDAAPANAYKEILVGYFLPQNENPLTALSQVSSYLLSIKTKNWSMDRNQLTDPWTYSSRTPILTPGEAVQLRYARTQPIDFQWVSSNITPAYSESTPQFFTYTEQMDYTPVYVSLGDLNKKNKSKNAELAIFINDVCYGAEVVEGDTIQINAYVSDPALLNANVEFRYWDPTMKNQSKSIDTYAVLDQTSHYQNRLFSFGERKPFYTVSLLQKDIIDGNKPLKNSLQGNYPNPFNPETNIKYSIANDGPVQLEVYNVKGQLVKTLVNEVQSSGYKSVLWRGDDNSGKKVSSGIYFYRLTAKNDSAVKKMILMK